MEVDSYHRPPLQPHYNTVVQMTHGQPLAKCPEMPFALGFLVARQKRLSHRIAGLGAVYVPIGSATIDLAMGMAGLRGGIAIGHTIAGIPCARPL